MAKDIQQDKFNILSLLLDLAPQQNYL